MIAPVAADFKSGVRSAGRGLNDGRDLFRKLVKAPNFPDMDKFATSGEQRTASNDCEFVIVALRPGPRRSLGFSAPQPPGAAPMDRVLIGKLPVILLSPRAYRAGPRRPIFCVRRRQACRRRAEFLIGMRTITERMPTPVTKRIAKRTGPQKSKAAKPAKAAGGAKRAGITDQAGSDQPSARPSAATRCSPNGRRRSGCRPSTRSSLSTSSRRSPRR